MKAAIWRWLGFGQANNPVPPQNPDFPELAYWSMVFKVSLMNRLRILVSGKVHMVLIARTKVKVTESVSAACFTALPPTYKTSERP